MTTINLDELSVPDLEKLKAGIDGTIKQKRTDELLTLRDNVDVLINESPFTLEEVLEAKKMKKPVPPKYKNPADENQTWTGRGRKPRWVEEFLSAGNDIEEIEI